MSSRDNFQDGFRDYTAPARDSVEAFYELNHRYQTFEFVTQQHKRFVTSPAQTRAMTLLEALAYLDTLVDDSDPDTDLSQLQHLLQTAETIRADGHDDWFVLTGFIHDLGKILCLSGEPQWAVVGDTFPVGCRYSDKIIYRDFFSANPDASNTLYQSENGIYEPGCGLRNIHMSWGHDEYLYQSVKDYLPEPALYMIRFHSFYAWHQSGAYDHLCDDHDREMLPWVQKFNPYDLYSKADDAVKWAELRPYYLGLIEKYLPAKIDWPV
jgi:inositol oxygenase